jgi:NAD-dependent dihydropyrimidine dehydrogenase PreA subunit
MVLDTANLTYILNGTSLAVAPEKCTGCGICLDVCPHAVLEIHNRKVVVSARERCMECGACRLNCPHEAIAVVSGVGCVAAIVNGLLKNTAPQCGCSTESESESTGCR